MLQLIVEVGDCLKQSQLTIHLAVNYMDRFLAAKKSLHRNVSDQNIRYVLGRAKIGRASLEKEALM